MWEQSTEQHCDDAVPAPAPADSAVRDVAAPASVDLGRAIVQAKLSVGPADDPYEREADRVADRVVRMIASRSQTHDAGPEGGPAEPKVRRSVSTPTVRCPIGCGDPTHGHTTVPRVQRHSGRGDAPEVGRAGGDVSSDVARRIRSSSGGGRPLDDITRSSMESAFGSDFGEVRVHRDSDLAPRLGAEAFTHGNDVHFAPGKYRPTERSGQWLLGHELTHVVQQQGPTRVAAKALDDAGPSIADSISDTTNYGPIQRHSSYEHMLIGDLTTDELATMGQWQDATDETLSLGNRELARTNVSHVIEQEIRRLKYFQENPPRGDAHDTTSEEHRLRNADRDDQGLEPHAQEGEVEDGDWDLRLVAIPMYGGRSFLVTYGELNTLGDFFGSVEEMKAMDPTWVDRLIRGIRASTMRELVKIYGKINDIGGLRPQRNARRELGLETAKFRSDDGDDDQIGLGGVVAELNLMGALPGSGDKKKPMVKGSATTDYGSTLARNACHFAPESWLAWGDNHRKARALALEAFDMFVEAETDDTLPDRMKSALERNAQVKYNEALLYNGFGDHYLQDSYAAGHLINKTQIMKWYVEWLDTKSGSWDAHREKNWRKVQDMAYSQPGMVDAIQYDKTRIGQTQVVGGETVGMARNPQAAENASGNWKQKAQILGLQVPSALSDVNAKKLLVAWQQNCAQTHRMRNPRTKKVSTLIALGSTDPFGLSERQVKTALEELHSSGIVRFDDYSESDRSLNWAEFDLRLTNSTKMVLRDSWVPASEASLEAAQADGGARYDDIALGITYEEYTEYMNSAFLQKATNTLHNIFCEEGLSVSQGNATEVMKIYGDNNMMNKNSSAGLRHSSETAKMSRQAIEDIGWTGQSAISIDHISTRFPTYVQPDEGPRLSLAEWHNGGVLEGYCKDTVFPGMANKFTEKFAPGALGADLGVITNDHPADAF